MDEHRNVVEGLWKDLEASNSAVSDMEESLAALITKESFWNVLEKRLDWHCSRSAAGPVLLLCAFPLTHRATNLLCACLTLAGTRKVGEVLLGNRAVHERELCSAPVPRSGGPHLRTRPADRQDLGGAG